jgi:hypothetical protein
MPACLLPFGRCDADNPAEVFRENMIRIMARFPAMAYARD